MNHLEEVALHRLVLYRLCFLEGGGGTVCTTWFSESFGGGCPTQVSAV